MVEGRGGQTGVRVRLADLPGAAQVGRREARAVCRAIALRATDCKATDHRAVDLTRRPAGRPVFRDRSS